MPDDPQDLILRCLKRDGQNLLLLPAVQRQNLVPLQRRHLPLKMKILCIHGLRIVLVLFHFRCEYPLRRRNLTDPGPQICPVRDILCDDVPRTGEGFLHRYYAFFRIDVCRCEILRRVIRLLLQEDVRKRLKPFLRRDGRAGSALWLVRSVQILQLDHRQRRFDLLFQRFRQLSLLFDGRKNRCLPVLERAEIGQTLIQLAQLLVIQRAMHLLSVSGDKRDGVSLVNQFHDRLYLPEADVQFLRYGFVDVQVLSPDLSAGA